MFGPLKRGLASSIALAFSSVAASAQSYSPSSSFWDWLTGGGGNHGGHHNTSSVPEIDASSGLLAIAAVLAALALAWEIRRRRRA